MAAEPQEKNASIAVGAFDEDGGLIQATREDGQSRVRVRAFDHLAVVLGRGGKPEVELNLPACFADQVPLLRRRGGGCAVVLDPGNVIVSRVESVEGIGGIRRHFDRLTTWLMEGLQRTGLQGLRREGTSDLTLGNRKVGGSCLHQSKGLLYYAATLLVAPRIDLMERYLAHPPREPSYRRGRSHREFVGKLSDLGIESAAGLAAVLAPSLPSVRAW